MASRMDEEREKQDSRVSVDYSRQHKTADRAVKQSSARKTNVAQQKVSSGGTMRSNTESRTGEGKSLVGNYERQHKTVEKRPVSSIRRSFTNYDSRNEFDPETLVGKSGRYWLAEISKIGESDREAGRELYDLYEQSKADVNSPLYDPYASATNTNPKYVQKNAAQTEKAKTEWQNLQKELSYWAQSDRNYSDEEILNRVNWKNYPTLAKMDADRAGEGSTVYLNEPVGYDQDAMYGVMWAARNPDLATGDTTMDAVLGTLGRGNQYQRDEQKAARLDPSSRDYNPYLVGSTMDSQLQTYGVNGFGSDWLNQNLQYRGTDDYTKVYKAEQTTKKAEQELSELKEQMNDLLDQGWTPEEVFTDDFLADYSTLQKLQNSIDNGSLIDTTRAIGYDRNALQQAYQEAYTKRYGTKSNSEYAADTAAAMGASVQQNSAQDLVDDAGDKKQKDYYQPIMQSGTDAEKNSVKAGTGTAGYNRTVAQVEEGIQSGTAGAEGAAASKQLTVAQKTAPKYFEAMEAVKNGAEPDYSEELTAILNKAGVDAGEEDYTAKVAASLSQKAAEGDQEAAVMLNDWNSVGVEEYWEKQDSAETATAYQAELENIKQQWKDAFGGDTPEYRSHVNTMEAISSFSEKPKNDWSAYDVVTLMSQQGVENIDQVTASARILNQQKIDYIDQILERAEQFGAPQAYIDNMTATQEQLERTNALIDSHSWKNNEDYAQAVESFDAAEINTNFWTLSGGDEEIIAAIKDPEAADAFLKSPVNMANGGAISLSKTSPDLFYTPEMTEEERDNFKYQYATGGQEAAMAYYNELRPMLSARYAAGESEAAQELGKKLPISSTVVSILGSLGQIEGSLYTAFAALTGQQADPNSMAFSANRMVSGAREGAKERGDELIDKVFEESEFAKQAFHFVYDAMTSAGDSLMSAYTGSAVPVLGAGKVAQTISKNAGLTMMSAVAASNTMQEALLKGVEPDKAFYAGLASGVAEAVTEKIPFDKITEAYKAGSKGGKIMKLLADNLIGEGLGEGMSEYLGAAGDYLVLGDDSDFIQSVNDYRADGMSEEAAIHQVVSELNRQALYATLSGAFSGVVSSGGSYAAGRLMNRVETKSGNTSVSSDVAQQTAENTVAEQGEGRQGETAQTASDAVSEEGASLTIRDAEGNVVEERNQPAKQNGQTEENALTALYTAQQNGVGEVQQTASVDAALRSFGMEPETSVAVSKRMVETESTEKATAILEAAPNRQKAAQAISMALLSPNSETAAVFADLNGQITAEDVNGLTQMYELDRLDDGAMGAYEAAIEESQLADETMAVLSQMDNGRVESARENAAKAQQAADQSGAKLEAANAGLEAAQASLETARQRRNENLNPETIAAESKALQQYGKAQEKQADAEAQYKADSKALKGAKEKVTAAQEEAVGQARSVALEQQAARQEIKRVDYAVQRQNVDANIQQVAQMGSVVTLNGNEFEVGGTELRQQVSDYFKSIGGVASNPILGDVALTQKGAKSSIAHGIGNGKAVAFAAVPSVIENGQIVDVQQNWKGRGYNTFVIAAPVTIEGGKSAGEYYCGVVVKRAAESQQYYVHEVVLANEEGANVAVQPTVRPNESSVALGGAKAPSVNSILQKVLDVKQGKTNSEKNYQEMSSILIQGMQSKAKNAEVASALQEAFSGPREQLQDQLREIVQKVASKSPQQDSEYAQMREILSGTKFSLNENQKSEVRNAFGKYGDYTKQLFKHGLYASDSASITLDSFWNELSELYPEYFSPDTSDAEMPLALLNWFDQSKKQSQNSWQSDETINLAVQLLMDKYSEMTGEQLRQGTTPTAKTSSDSELWFAFHPNTVATNDQTGVATKKVTSPVDAAKSLAKALNVGQDIGSRKVPRGVLGYYDAQAKYLAVRSTEAGNISTTMHELGHALADKLGMTGTMQMVDALDPVFAQNYSANDLPGEAFAEFMWRYMTDDASAQAFAGDAFLYDFERALKKNGLDRQVHKTRDQMHEYVNATVNQRIGAVVKDRSEKPKSSLKEIRTKLTDMLVDSTSVLEDVNNVVREQTGKTDVRMGENLRNTALMRNTASRRAYNMLTDTLTDSSWQSIGDGLAKRFENAGIRGKDFDLLNNYMLAMHSLDRDAAGKPVFDSSMTKAQRETYIQDVQQNHPEVARAEQEFQQFRNEFMQAFLVDTGYMTQETLDLFNKMYPHYVPTFRMKDGKGSGSGVSGKSFSIKRAKGSTENIYNPMDSFVQMMDSIVNMVSQNNTALVWDKVYHQYEGLGLYGREVTQDVQSESADTTGLQDKIRKILEGANTDNDIMQQVMDTIGPEQVQWKGTGNVNLPNVLTVQKADGSKAYYEIFDTEMYKALSGYKETAGKVWQLIGKATKAMSALTTGSNTVFAIRNFLRDFQKSVTYGSWASNYVTGTGKWLRAAWDVWREKGEYGDYKALGGGGWNRIETGSRKGAEAYRGDLFKGYNTSNVGRTAKWAGQKIWNVVTFSRLNEVIEQTSRYAEYRYGKQDKTTAEGKQQAFLNAQEATVDFSRSGYSNIASDLKQVIPFLGASTQGIYQTGREFTTKAERSRLPERFAKTVINTALASVLANLLVFKHTDDDDKEEYAMLSDEMLAENFFIPNPSAEIFGERPYLRIPLGQDPIMRAVHGAVTNALWSGKVDGPLIELAAIGQNILDGFNPVNGTIFDAAISTATNRNYYGSKTVPDRMKGWDPTTQYTEETADVFINASRWLDETVGIGISPMMIQYLAEQYTGFLGQMAIPALSKDKHTGEMGGIKAAIASVQKRLTSDPLMSNGITSSFYDGVAELQEVTYAAKNERPLNMLRRGLTDDEARAAVDEAKSLTGTNGALGQAKKFLSDGYARIDEIEARTDLSDHEKYLMTSEIRREMMDNTLAAQELIGEYKAKYIDGENILSRLAEGVYGRESTAFEKLPERYLTAYQSGDGYMQRAYDAWEISGKASALPHANYTFTDKKVEYEVAEEDQEQFDSIYQDAYKQYVDRNTNDRRWEHMTADEKLAFMQKAHEKAQTEAKKWWLKKKK